MVRSGEISARELVMTSLTRIEALNPDLNAFVDVDAERALATAEEIGPGDGRPFAGVPVAIKNNRPVQGLRLTNGCSLMEHNMCDYDHNVPRRLKEAGFVIVRTTTLPEYGILPVSEARIFGPTRNPWDLGRTPGGSSGGAAAAVASGMVLVAHGNDGGGSIRIPAACCGLVGLKPSRGRISTAPELGDSALVVDGMLTRTVADTAAILDVLAGYEPGDATWAPQPIEAFAQSAKRAPSSLRIAMTKLSTNRRRSRQPALLAGRRRRGRAAALARARGRGGRPAVADRRSSPTTSRCRSPIQAGSPGAGRAGSQQRTWSR
jgi:amidase